MTIATLERAKEIRMEIDDLRKSLSQITRGKLFDLETGSGCYTRQADPFLAQVENDIKTYANSAILKKIESLESEFTSL